MTNNLLCFEFVFFCILHDKMLMKKYNTVIIKNIVEQIIVKILIGLIFKEK